jgi:hypothetical protein
MKYLAYSQLCWPPISSVTQEMRAAFGFRLRLHNSLALMKQRKSSLTQNQILAAESGNPSKWKTASKSRSSEN